MNQEIVLKLTVAEVNTVLAALSKLPYDQVYSVIDKVKTQGQAQINDAPDEGEQAE